MDMAKDHAERLTDAHEESKVNDAERAEMFVKEVNEAAPSDEL